MQKILNLIMLALLVPFALTAQIWGDDMIIVGQVTEIGSPVANHMVSVSYSANMPGGISGTETTLTNVDGYYQFNITDGSISGPTIVFEVFTEDSCSGVLYEVINNGQGTVDIDTVNFELCGGVGCGVDISYVNDPTLGGNMLTANPTGVAPFTYQWDSGETSGTIFPPEPLNGTYCVTVVDANGCVATSCYTFNNTGCSAMISLNEDSIGGVLNAEVWVVATGVAPFTYEWSNGATTESIYLQNIVGVDTICVTITDANGCTSTSCELIGFEPGNCEGWISGYVGVTAINAPIPLDQGTVWLITYDATTNLLTAVDSASIDSGGYFSFGPIPCGDYLVKAAAGPNSAYYSDHIPTYFGNSPFWGFAQTITLGQVNTQVTADVTLIAASNPGGPGFIGGLVSEGANKMDPGDPVGGMQVNLFDMNGNAIAYTYTDENGEFGFENLAYGTYQVYVEQLGVQTIPAIVTIGPDASEVDDIQIWASESLITTGINEFDFEGAISGVYPNPVADNAAINFNLEAEVMVKINVVDLTGRTISTTTTSVASGDNTLRISTDNLNEGYYFLNIQDVDGAFSVTRKFMRVD